VRAPGNQTIGTHRQETEFFNRDTDGQMDGQTDGQTDRHRTGFPVPRLFHSVGMPLARLDGLLDSILLGLVDDFLPGLAEGFFDGILDGFFNVIMLDLVEASC
jgi:hypothetical protein